MAEGLRGAASSTLRLLGNLWSGEDALVPRLWSSQTAPRRLLALPEQSRAGGPARVRLLAQLELLCSASLLRKKPPRRGAFVQALLSEPRRFGDFVALRPAEHAEQLAQLCYFALLL